MWWENKYSVKSIFPLLGPQGQGTTKNRTKSGATSIDFLWLCDGYDERNPRVNYVVHFPGINLPPPHPNGSLSNDNCFILWWYCKCKGCTCRRKWKHTKEMETHYRVKGNKKPSTE